jgi:hypothetical protein
MKLYLFTSPNLVADMQLPAGYWPLARYKEGPQRILFK